MTTMKDIVVKGAREQYENQRFSNVHKLIDDIKVV